MNNNKLKRVYYPDYLNLMKYKVFVRDAIPVKDNKGNIIAYDIPEKLDKELESSWWD